MIACSRTLCVVVIRIAVVALIVAADCLRIAVAALVVARDCLICIVEIVALSTLAYIICLASSQCPEIGMAINTSVDPGKTKIGALGGTEIRATPRIGPTRRNLSVSGTLGPQIGKRHRLLPAPRLRVRES